MNKKQRGDAFEDAGCEYLQKQGLILLDRQARYKLGELDLIMQDKSCLVFIEVRFRQYQAYGGATWSISRSKMRKLRNAAFLWMKIHGYSCSNTEFRFDALTFESDIKSVNWIQNIIIEG